jgi:hypothetical protein
MRTFLELLAIYTAFGAGFAVHDDMVVREQRIDYGQRPLRPRTRVVSVVATIAFWPFVTAFVVRRIRRKARR